MSKRKAQNNRLNPLMTRLLSAFENKSGLERPEWRDVSRYQGFVNMPVLKANGVMGLTARSTISWGYTDPTFELNRKNALAVAMYFNSYHVIYPGESVVRQTDNWYAAHPTHDGIARVIDMELQHMQSFKKIADAMWEMSDLVKSRDGFRPIIYSRYMLIDQWLASWTTDMLNEHYYFLAQYLFDRFREHPGPPTLPKRVSADRVFLHQTSDKKADYPGAVDSYSSDRGRFILGDEAALHALVSDEWGGGVGPPPEEEITFPLPEIEGTIGGIDVRENRKAINIIADKIGL